MAENELINAFNTDTIKERDVQRYNNYLRTHGFKDTIIEKSITEDNFHLLSTALRKGILVSDTINSDLSNPLHIACELKRVRFLPILIENNVNFEVHNKKGESAFLIALLTKTPELIATFIQSVKFKLDKSNLWKQFYYYYFKIISFIAADDIQSLTNFINLHQNQININFPEIILESPLEIAVHLQLPMIINYLLRLGANITSERRCTIGKTIAHVAVKKNDSVSLTKIMDSGFDAETKLYKGLTVLLYACKLGRFELVKLLIYSGKGFGNQDINGKNALIYSIEYSKFEIMEFLLQSGADVNGTDIKNNSPLSVALMDENIPEWVVEFLLFRGADPNLRNAYGVTPLMIAAKNCNPEIFKLLLNHSANPCFIDTSGRTIVHYVIQNSNGYTVTLVLETCLYRNPQLINSGDINGNTPLHFNILNETNGGFSNVIVNCSLVNLLLSYGGHFNAINIFGHYAQPTIGHKETCNRSNCSLNKLLKKLDIVGWYVNERYTKDHTDFSFLNIFPSNQINKSEIRFSRRCVIEKSAISTIIIQFNPVKSLWDLLFMSPNTQAFFCKKNEIILNILVNNLENFIQTYPLFGFIFKIIMVRARERAQLLEEAYYKLKSLFCSWLPPLIMNDIFQYFTDKQLEKFVIG